MATLLLSAAGAAVGGMLGGSVLGLSSVAIGRFVGGVLGNAIDQRIMGAGSRTIETGRIDRYRITGTGEGRPIARLYGKQRIGGHVIWATEFEEHVTTSGGGGGKGRPAGPTVQQFSYSVSLAIALCEGEITGVTRIWADGEEIAMRDLNMRVYTGSDTQLPDPKIEAVEGLNTVPAYRGLAYVVFEDLALEGFGNRIPQFSFEVSRPSPRAQEWAEVEPSYATQAVALIPGSGEYALATEPVFVTQDVASQRAVNMNARSGSSDFVTATYALDRELPNCGAVSLVVSWFGDDLRCGDCEIKPKVEANDLQASLDWSVAGVTRPVAEVVPLDGGRPVYGGTPTDASVIQAIRHLNELGKEVMFYPFILMDQMAGNGLPDPWSDADDQPVLPWRGRVTVSEAPGRAGSPDQTALAETEVAAFFGTASAADFVVGDGTVAYSGPQEWRYRRFILHQAALCAAAGGVESFCIGSEMRSLTWVRGEADRFVAVEQLIALAAEARAILGPDVKIGYAADWSEYFGYHPQDGSGDLWFHLDALWADPNIDFVGIDNYMPLSDWRDEKGHADEGYGSIYNLEYLMANVEGGEGYDWFYHSPEAEAAQIRTPITDGAYGEPWVWRYKDIRNWWSLEHYNRIGGIRAGTPTAWVPESKPIRFCEIGCAAVDKGTNQPNKFVDPKSSESSLPKYSDGRRDEYIQHQYLSALYGYWGDAARNPVSEVYGGAMVDMSKAYVWAWDTRPWPWFPSGDALWSDSDNYGRGHWISGRVTHRTLASVVREVCDAAGVEADVSDLRGMVRGYTVADVTEPRAVLQPLILQFGFDAIEREGVLVFRMRGAEAVDEVVPLLTALSEDVPHGIAFERGSEAELMGRVRISFVESGSDYRIVSEEAVLADEASHGVAGSEVALSLLRGEGKATAERWLAEARLARDTVRFSLPLSRLALGAGDVVRIGAEAGARCYRIDRVELGEVLTYDATAVDASVYERPELEPTEAHIPVVAAPVPVQPLFMDLPLMRGDEEPHAPHVVAVAEPWPGAIAVYDAPSDENYQLNTTQAGRARFGVLESDLGVGPVGVVDRGASVRVRMRSGALSSMSQEAMLVGGNVALIGDGTPEGWEVVQFQTAQLVAPQTYEVSDRLRGQRGSEERAWPAGSWFVLFDGVPSQIELASAQRGIERHFRIGPARQALSDASYVHEVHAFAGNGLRPYAPVHLRAWMSGGDVSVSWIRQTRVDGDRWDLGDVPLGEESETYELRVSVDGQLVRQENVTASTWSYTAADQALDNAEGLVTFDVAQVSARFGAGRRASVSIGL
ncbi:glycoside hydrolase/phage tail family protein [Cognatishimia sp. D5M38]|uniref:Glycoside hydrolase/phage tail family protein n=1 Tax=Cognatishimia coralii TaxID=3083254 RepID=A0ABU8QBQ3_9RHOB